MSGLKYLTKTKKAAASLPILLAVGVTSPTHADTVMTAGVVVDKMPVRERAAYVAGIVEGLAYARFRKDTLAAGAKSQQGMNCIYDWYYTDTAKTFERIQAAFRQHADHYPSTVLASMIKQECGE